MNSNFNSFFQNIKWDERFSWFEGSYISENNEVMIFYIVSTDSNNISPINETLAFFVEVGNTIDYLIQEIADKYYPVYCHDWAVSKPVMKSVFTDSIRLSVITYYALHEKRLTFKANDFFGNHDFCVNIGEEVTIKGIVLEG
jgi:hypothetical protein